MGELLLKEIEGWPLRRLGDDVRVKGRIGWKGYTKADLVANGPWVVGGTEVKSFLHLDLAGAKHLTREKFEESPEIKLMPGDVLLATRGNLADCAYVDETIGEATINPSLIILSEFKGNPQYLYYYLVSAVGRANVLSLRSGSSVPAIYQAHVKELSYPAPPIEVQTQIAEMLSALDDKIELNRRMNATLEAMAQAVFEKWFVDGAKEEWEEKTFGELLETNVGGDWGQEVADDEHTERVAIIRGADFPDVQNQSRGKVPIRFTKPSKLKTRKLQPGDLVLEISGGTKDRPTGRCVQVTENMLGWFDEPVVAASFCRLLRPKAGLSNYLALHMDHIYRQGKTWSYQNVSTGLSNFQTKEFLLREILPLPSAKVIDAFNAIIDPITAKRTTSESMTLAALRDTLLPKLMRGEVRVSLELKTE